MYLVHVHKPTIIVDFVASNDLWIICNVFLDYTKVLNKINILKRSHFKKKTIKGGLPISFLN
jgi:hypothetical protein